MPILFSNSTINRLYVDLQIFFSWSVVNPHYKQNTVLRYLKGINTKIEWSTRLKDFATVLSWKTECVKNTAHLSEIPTNTKYYMW